MTRRFDVLVVGSGIAGLSFALKVARQGRSVAILTKKNKADSNTNWAQGGIAVVTAQTDAFAKHVKDTLVAGDASGFEIYEQLKGAISVDVPETLSRTLAWRGYFATLMIDNQKFRKAVFV